MKTKEANRKNAQRWWHNRNEILNSITPTVYSNYVSELARKKFYLKAMPGHGRKRQEWVQLVHNFVFNEIYCLSDIGVKTNRSMLIDIARHAMTYQ